MDWLRSNLPRMQGSIVALTVCLALTGTAYAAGALITLAPNEIRSVEGAQGCPVSYVAKDASHGDLTCGAPPEVIEGVAVCTDHNPTVWHPLVKKSGATITCTYGHEHHDDPNAVNDIFGQPGAWYGAPQAISYPWQTSSSAGLENNVKHEGYKWYVKRDHPCLPFGDPAYTGCFRSWRIVMHTLGTAADAVVRHHSFGFEAVVEFQGRQGIVRHGGWMDTGHLALQTSGAKACPPLSGNPTSFTCGSQVMRVHSGTNVPPPNTGHNGYIVNWYASHIISQVGPAFEEWGPIDYQNPTARVDHPANLKANNSAGRIENMAFNAYGPNFYFSPWTQNGLVTFNGYTDQHGTPVDGCTTPAPACVPLKIEGAPSIVYGFNSSASGVPDLSEYDVPSPSTGKSLIRFPN